MLRCCVTDDVHLQSSDLLKLTMFMLGDAHSSLTMAFIVAGPMRLSNVGP